MDIYSVNEIKWTQFLVHAQNASRLLVDLTLKTSKFHIFVGIFFQENEYSFHAKPNFFYESRAN